MVPGLRADGGFLARRLAGHPIAEQGVRGRPVHAHLDQAVGRGVLREHHGLAARLIDYRNSGDTAGGRDRVVGYAAFAFDEGTGGYDAGQGNILLAGEKLTRIQLISECSLPWPIKENETFGVNSNRFTLSPDSPSSSLNNLLDKVISKEFFSLLVKSTLTLFPLIESKLKAVFCLSLFSFENSDSRMFLGDKR